MKAHKHCWHVKSSTTTGLADKGWDNEVCCHCGAKQQRPWERRQDPQHGPHVDATITIYKGQPREDK